MVALETVAKILLALAAVAFISYPFLRPASHEVLAATSKSETMIERRDQVEAALREVEFDYRTGKLPEKDFKDLTDRFRREQAEILTLLDLPERLGSEAAADQPRVKPVRAGRAVDAPKCSECGMELRPGNKFCGFCGAKV